MIFVTGDTHSEVSRLSTDIFPEQKEMTKDDYVIILGDFGLIWNVTESEREKYWLDWLNNKPFTTLFIDGNHENYDRLNTYSIEDWHGGQVQKIRPSIIHLMRGQVYNIDNITFFTFGGARSTDIHDGILGANDTNKIQQYINEHKAFRINHISWWEQEMPTKQEMQTGIDNLRNVGNQVDFILTHSPSSTDLAIMKPGQSQQNELTKYLTQIQQNVKYKKWLFGHMHENKNIIPNSVCIYEQIIRVV